MRTKVQTMCGTRVVRETVSQTWQEFYLPALTPDQWLRVYVDAAAPGEEELWYLAVVLKK